MNKTLVNRLPLIFEGSTVMKLLALSSLFFSIFFYNSFAFAYKANKHFSFAELEKLELVEIRKKRNAKGNNKTHDPGYGLPICTLTSTQTVFSKKASTWMVKFDDLSIQKINKKEQEFLDKLFSRLGIEGVTTVFNSLEQTCGRTYGGLRYGSKGQSYYENEIPPKDLFRGQTYEGIITESSDSQMLGKKCELSAFFKDQSILKGPELAKLWAKHGYYFKPEYLKFKSASLESDIAVTSSAILADFKVYGTASISFNDYVKSDQGCYEAKIKLDYKHTASRVEKISIKAWKQCPGQSSASLKEFLVCANVKRTDPHPPPEIERFDIELSELKELDNFRSNRNAIGMLGPRGYKSNDEGGGLHDCQKFITDTWFKKTNDNWQITIDKIYPIWYGIFFGGGWDAKSRADEAANAPTNGSVNENEMSFIQRILERLNATDTGVNEIRVTQRGYCRFAGDLSDGQLTKQEDDLYVRSFAVIFR